MTGAEIRREPQEGRMRRDIFVSVVVPLDNDADILQNKEAAQQDQYDA